MFNIANIKKLIVPFIPTSLIELTLAKLAFANLPADFVAPKLRYCEAKAEGMGFEPMGPVKGPRFSKPFR